ncbi:MAG: molybdopterin-dependent oxidoreductase, partial [Chloroflexota bacterium]|nr:molybdopterin-dependent oxidoreductase [Chloroflexota bacterium]
MSTRVTHSSHWGAFEAVVENGSVTGVVPWAGDQHPSPLLANIPGSTEHKARISQPHVRAGWLRDGSGPSDRRGSDELVPVSWDEALDLAATELRRVIEAHGNRAIYGGSYGWSSAGRFHHAQSQLHRFLNVLGGYVGHVNTYSNAAGEVILDRVVGSMRDVIFKATAWEVIAEHTDLVLAFGGLPLKNSAVSPGGASRHVMRNQLIAAAERGCEFVYVSPLKDDLIDEAGGTWIAPIPGTDVPIMLAMAYVLLDEGLADRAFIDRYTAGFDEFARYLCGEDDGTPKTPEWAAEISGIPASTIAELARKLVRGRTLISVSWSLQRTQHGEQPPWAALALAAMTGQIGLPGGGYGFGYASMASVGEDSHMLGAPLLPQGQNPVRDFIPVARISDMLLNPGAEFDYDGQRLTYPDIKVVYWGGGNPFHHHQDLARLRRALGRVDTVIVHDPYWTPMARHADIVFPSTVTLERDDIGAASTDPLIVAMKQGVEPFAQARDDYATFTELARRLGKEQDFTEGRSAAEWLRHIYDVWADRVERRWPEVPTFEEFQERGFVELPLPEKPTVMFEAFREDPEGKPLRTLSGRIEIHSETIA